MKCPACPSPLQQTINRHGKVVDYCEHCQGMWLDNGELFSYTKRIGDLNEALSRPLLQAHQGQRVCPRCGPGNLMEVGGLLQPDLEVDRCTCCGGIWFDSGELNKYKDIEGQGSTAQLLNRLQKRSGGTSQRLPGFVEPSNQNAVSELEATRKTSGAASPGGKATSAPGSTASGASGDDTASDSAPDEYQAGSPGELAAFPLPSLAFRSLATVGVLYGILYIILVLATQAMNLHPMVSILTTAAVLLVQFIISPWIMDWQLGWFYSCDWVSPQQLPEHLEQFVRKVATKHGMAFPCFGVIRDGSPNAFTYGRYPGDARIIITRGLMEKLTPHELESVVAHEIGHVVHWDMALMTLAAMVPIVLYQVYNVLMRFVRRAGGGRNNGKGALAIVALVAYLCYIVSEYIVLFLSRTREYHADTFAAEECANSNYLASALVKVAYGLASDMSVVAGESGEDTAGRREATSGRMFAPLGIFDPTSAKALVSSTAVVGGTGGADRERIKDAMQWDLWNPWASYFELHSTHPLTANRLDQLGRLSFRYGHKPFVLFDREQPESFWDEFFVDFLMLYLPLISGICGTYVAMSAHHHWYGTFGGFLLGYGAGNLVQLFFSYKFEFFTQTVASLLKNVKVSGIRAIPARLKGKIIGKGIPGYILSEDMTFQDQTGFMFVDYQQPLAVMEWWFALTKDAYVGQEVVLEGWYKRAPVPYFELYKVKSRSGEILSTCWTYTMRWVFTFGMMIGGAFLAFGGV